MSAELRSSAAEAAIADLQRAHKAVDAAAGFIGAGVTDEQIAAARRALTELQRALWPLARADVDVAAVAASTYRVERYDPAWGGYRNDDLTIHGLPLRKARLAARVASQISTQSQQVVDESTGEAVAEYRHGVRVR